MGSSHRLQRALACACIALALSSALGCGELLGISEPFPRVTAGSAGESSSAGNSVNEGGDAGLGGSSAVAGDSGVAGASEELCPQLGARQCRGQLPEVCTGSWQVDESENDGQPCPVLCIGGKCAECRVGERRCTANEAQHCDAGAWVKEQECAAYCLSGACVNPPSCAALGERFCGGNQSCCNAIPVPGGPYIRDYDGNEYLSKSYTATISPFLLDRFEVTLARFKAFVAAYPKLQLEAGAGKSPHISNDDGWQVSNALPVDSEALERSLSCPGGVWPPPQADSLTRPINCVGFDVAYAFCIWDGGRLPTEAEWNFAAAGGTEQREYPWSTPTNASLDADHAFYGQLGANGLPGAVGSKPIGNGRWGHADLAGNVAEWTLDYFSPLYPTTVCDDCLNNAVQPTRSVRGGSYRFGEAPLKSSARRAYVPNSPLSYVGFRCAHDLPSTIHDEMVTQ